METIYFKKPTEQSYFQRGHGSPELEKGPGARSGCSVTLLYFAYGSNTDLEQMDFRCPDAQALETVRLEGYRLAFRSNGGNRGVATILPDPDSHVDGVLWEISPEDERNLNFYEGFPRLYGKRTLTVVNRLGKEVEAMAYVMNAPYKDRPAVPSASYLRGILRGCQHNGIDTRPVLAANLDALEHTDLEGNPPRGKQTPER